MTDIITTEFIHRFRANGIGHLKEVATLRLAPVGIVVGSEIEIDHVQYRVAAINPLVFTERGPTGPCTINYQVYVELID